MVKENSQSRPVLVTGANGLVGSHLVESLLATGHGVSALMRPTSNGRWVESSGASILRIDYDDQANLLAEAVSGHEVVYHVAGATRALNYEGFLRVNARLTETVLQACLNAREPPRRVVLVSSVGATGPAPPGVPLTPDAPENPGTDYGRSKLEGERRARRFQDDIELVIVRPTSIYGPRDVEMLPLFKAACKGHLLTFNGPDQLLNLCHVEDIARGIVLAGAAEVETGSVFILGDSCEYTMKQIRDMLGQITGSSPRLWKLPFPLLWSAALVSEGWAKLRSRPAMFNRQKLPELCGTWQLDISASSEQLGFQPKWDLRSGLAHTYNWYREHNYL